MKRNIVFSTISIDHDISSDGSRWKLWRPLVELVRNRDFRIDRLYYFVPPSLRSGLGVLQQDLEAAAPETEIIPIAIDTKHNFSPASFSENYLFFDKFFENFKFDYKNDSYFMHFGPGNMFAHSFMIMMLISNKNIACHILQLRSQKNAEGAISSAVQVYDSSIRNWISTIGTIEIDKNAESLLTAGIPTRNADFNRLVREIEHVAARSTAPILLEGTTGTGKTLMARRIYDLRLRNGLVKGQLIEVNCASFKGDAAISALFGHVKGAFTGSVSERKGMLSLADKGVLFLDEIGELNLETQALLLKAVEEKRFYPFGADTPVYSDFQLITATNRNLRQSVRQGDFRLDLLARIDLWHFRLPSLRERPEDIPPNIDFELRRLSEKRGIFADFLPEARREYTEFAMSADGRWPGNFRTLAGSIERMHTLAFQGIITIEIVRQEIAHLKNRWAQSSMDMPREAYPLTARFAGQIGRDLDLFEKPQLEKVLETCLASKNRSEAGRALFGVSRLQKSSHDDTARLTKYLRGYNLSWDAVRAGEQLSAGGTAT